MNRKRFNRIAYCCLIIISLASCKKEEVVLPESNDPVFRVDGSFDGQNFSLIAGDNNAYMHTMTETVNGVEVFSGNLSNGDFSVEMGVYNGLIDMPSSQVVLELVDLNPNFSMNSTQGLMFLSKNMLVSPSGQYIEQIFWYIDGVFAGVNDVVIYDPGKYEVCAEAKFADGTVQSLCNELIVGYKHNANFSIDFSIDQLGNLESSIDNMGYDINMVNWTMDSVSMTNQTDYLQQVVNSGVHYLNAQVHFTNGVVRSKTALIDGSLAARHIPDFTVFEETAPEFIIPRDFNIRLKVKSAGSLYLSEMVDNSNSSLTITGVEYYGKNSSGNDVYKIMVNVSAQLKETITLETVSINFSSSFGIEIP
jgi:hypothetical protein